MEGELLPLYLYYNQQNLTTPPPQAFIDTTGGIWQEGALSGKYAGVFISTASLGGGQESTAMNAMSTFVHHGLIFVPLGYKHAFPILADLSEIRGGSPWGAGTFAVSPRIPTMDDK